MKEDRRIQLTTKGNKKVMLLTQLVTLTGSQEEKLNCEQLLPELERIAKMLAIDWAVELSANIEYGTLAVSRIHENEIGNCEFNSIEKAAKEFLSAIDKLKLPKPEPECPSHEDSEEEMTTKQFVEKLLHDLELPKEDADHVIGAHIICMGPKSLPFLLPWGQLGYDVLKEMCKLYLAAHEND